MDDDITATLCVRTFRLIGISSRDKLIPVFAGLLSVINGNPVSGLFFVGRLRRMLNIIFCTRPITEVKFEPIKTCEMLLAIGARSS